jgi:hypothetical protein
MAKKTPTTDIVLSQKELNEEGIKTQLTQNDLLEVIVTEKYEAFQNEMNDINQASSKLRDHFYKMKESIAKKAVQAIIKKYGLPVNLDEPNVSHSLHNSSLSVTKNRSVVTKHSYKSERFPVINTYRSSSKEYVQCGGVDYVYIPERDCDKIYCHFDLIVKVQGELAPGVTHDSVYRINDMYYELTTPEYKGLVKNIRQLAKQADEFVERYKDMDVRYESILKEMRVKFNKSLIANSAPGLRKKINGVFHINLV